MKTIVNKDPESPYCQRDLNLARLDLGRRSTPWRPPRRRSLARWSRAACRGTFRACSAMSRSGGRLCSQPASRPRRLSVAGMGFSDEHGPQKDVQEGCFGFVHAMSWG